MPAGLRAVGIVKTSVSTAGHKGLQQAALVVPLKLIEISSAASLPDGRFRSGWWDRFRSNRPRCSTSWCCLVIATLVAMVRIGFRSCGDGP